MKTTNVQLRVLEQMVDAHTTIRTISGKDGQSAFFCGLLHKPGGTMVRIQTVWALQDKELIADIGDLGRSWTSHEYEITETGQQIVEEKRNVT